MQREGTHNNIALVTRFEPPADQVLTSNLASIQSCQRSDCPRVSIQCIDRIRLRPDAHLEVFFNNALGVVRPCCRVAFGTSLRALEAPALVKTLTPCIIDTGDGSRWTSTLLECVP